VSRFLAIDLGERRIGVAMADTVSGSIKALVTMHRAHSASRDAQKLVTLAGEQDAHEFVVGWPLNVDGSEGSQAFDTRTWADELRRHSKMSVSFRDERHTSQRAELEVGRMARRSDGGPPSAKTRSAHRARVDQLAAESIAQAELDARREANTK
jgi:putative Holliday junction resolvase